MGLHLKSYRERRRPSLSIIILGLVLVLGCGRLPENPAGNSIKPLIHPVEMVGRSQYLPPHPQRPADLSGQDRELSEAEQAFGVKVLSLRLTSGGYMLDFRYQVLEPEKAKPLLDKKSQAYLFDPRSGARLSVPTSPKVGSLRTKTQEPRAGRVYFMIFSNPGGFLRTGDKVNVVIGEFEAKGIVVQ